MDGSRPEQISGAPGGTQRTGTRLNGDASDGLASSPSRRVRLQERGAGTCGNPPRILEGRICTDFLTPAGQCVDNCEIVNFQNFDVKAMWSLSVPKYKHNLHCSRFEDSNSLNSEDSGIPTLEIANPEPIHCGVLNVRTNHADSSQIIGLAPDKLGQGSGSLPPGMCSPAVRLETDSALRKSSTFPRSGYDNVKLYSPSSRGANKADEISVSSISSLSTELSTTLSVSNEDILDSLVTSDSSAIVNLETDEAQFTDISLNSSRESYNQADSPLEQETKYKRLGTLANFFTRSLFTKKLKDPASLEQNVQGWKLFGRMPAKESPLKESKNVQQEYEERSGRAQKSPSPNQRLRKNLDFEPLSTTALILEDRPANLPAKPAEEAQKHRQQYEEMVAQVKKREQKDAQRRRKLLEDRCKLEETIGNAVVTWNHEILPNWDAMRHSRKVRDLWWQGIPPSVRGKVWSLAIGNELNITHELYDICLTRAKDKCRSLSTAHSDVDSEDLELSVADREASLELIKLDISRTFPNLCIFQQGGPYYDVLHSILGAYTCYRPDVGYVQGMSFIAAVLILNLDTADAFIAFANLLNKPCQMAFFRVDHGLMLKYFAAFEVFFEENLPRLFAHFKRNNLTPDIYLIDWIFTLYSKSFPLDLACRVWDVFCRDGEEFLFRTALGILKLYEDVLTQLDFIHMAQFLTKLPEDMSSEDLFGAIGTIHLQSRNKKWAQVLSALQKDTKEVDKGSPALKR
ncbi:TBC1 domain family member 14-like isoform X1 [Stegostoma tigrinum]|uniref:TBC1 domain family member 14-like isoform X1 n=1 Tax=Stegostoma tigrinum TaxID=3053191 RepID=UPI00202B5ABB|nr:TBC1 domain family member 14-like isoform X1 [Stegostoma tigrinum]